MMFCLLFPQKLNSNGGSSRQPFPIPRPFRLHSLNDSDAIQTDFQPYFIPGKGAFTLEKNFIKVSFLGVAMCWSCGLWELGVGQLRYRGVIVWGSCSVGELPCGGS